MSNTGRAGSAAACVEAREDKHMSLGNAINDLEDVVCQLEGLSARISEVPMSDSDKVASCSYSLEETIASGASRINDQRQRMFELIDEITNKIF